MNGVKVQISHLRGVWFPVGVACGVGVAQLLVEFLGAERRGGEGRGGEGRGGEGRGGGGQGKEALVKGMCRLTVAPGLLLCSSEQRNDASPTE